MPHRDDNFYSDEAQEIMGKAPSWVVRRGITVVFIIFASILLGGYFIKYPETETAPVELTALDPPVDVIAKYDGILDTVCVENGSMIRKGGVLAVLSDRMLYKNVMDLESRLLQSYDNRFREIVFEDWVGKSYVSGDVLPAFADFQSSCLDYRDYLRTSSWAQQRKLLEERIRRSEEHCRRLKERMAVLCEDLDCEYKNPEMDSAAYAQGKVFRSDSGSAIGNVLGSEINASVLAEKLSSLEMDIIRSRQQLAQLYCREREECASYERSIDSARQNLSASIAEWREKYVVQSPADGTVSLPDYRSRHKRISAGERIATIMSEGKMKVMGRMRVPASALGRIQAGQRVNVKLDGYPYMEYGILRGTVASVSAIPDCTTENGTRVYTVELQLPQGLITSHNKELPFVQQMSGQGEIITRERRLTEIFIQPVLALFRSR